MVDLAELQKRLGVSFSEPTTLEQALVHRSYLNENPDFTLSSNERLEFIGDAVLGLVIAEKLYLDLPQLSEGELTRLRAALVRRDTLACRAKALGLDGYLYLGKGEKDSGGQRRSRNLAGALEAVIGAIFLDLGSAVAGDFILRIFAEELKEVVRGRVAVDYKSQLQELVQALKQVAPTYRVVEETGPAHARWFTVEVNIGDNVAGRGSGANKKTAEAEAAYAALQKLSHLT